METQLQELKTRLHEVNDLNSAAALLNWDQSTYMPEGGAPARGRQMALLSRVAQEKFTAPEIGRLLDDLEKHADDLDYESDEAALLRLVRRQYDRATKIPPDFLATFYQHAAEAYTAWTAARPANDFARMQPYLEKTLEYSRQMANYFPGYDHIADPLIDQSDYGMKAESIRKVFSELREELVPLVKAISAQEPPDDSCLRYHYPVDEQLAFGLKIARLFGYDLKRGRQDLTHHPFMTKFSIGDVRITTRAKTDYLAEALFSTLHETGHALYEQGLNPDFEGTPLARGTSSGVHESQSRLWENVVGRSLPFWQHFYRELQTTFPEQLGNVELDTFYRAVNRVEPSLIRTDADEVTYNLHIMIRFDLELDMLEGNLAIKDLPDAWHARYESDLGVRAPDNRDGVLQDVHWFAGAIGGAFQGYALGNILNAQFYAAALEAHPEIPREIGQGQFETLHTYLKENIYRHGSKFTPDELVERVTGGPISIRPFVDYLQTKFGTLYNL